MSYDEKFTMENEDNLEFIQRVLPKDKYRNVRRFKSGGTRDIFIADYGPFSDKRVVIKVDRTPESPRAIRHVERGCNTKNELERILRIQDGEEHFIKCIIDYYIKPDRNGNERTITVENFFPGKSLQEIVEESGPLNVGEVKSVFSQILEGVRYLIREQELFHRDLKPSNILVAKGRKIKAMITDHANARSIKEIEQDGPKVLPTAGGHHILDAFSTGQFTGVNQTYDDKSEMYAIGIDLYYALTGVYPFEYDPDKNIARSIGSGRDLFGKNPIVDRKKHDQELEIVLRKLPKKARKFSGILRKCLISDKIRRYSCIEELVEDFDEKTQPSFMDGIRASWKSWLVKLSIIGVSGVLFYNTIQDIKSNMREASKYRVVTDWDGDKLEIVNNLVDFGPSFGYASSSAAAGEIALGERYPQDRILHVEPGDILNFAIEAKYLPRPASSPSSGTDLSMLKGMVYLEGLKGKSFSLIPYPVDPTILDESDSWSHGLGSGMVEIGVPKDISAGTHILAFELFAPENKEDSSIKFDKPNKVLSRKRVPIVVGHPSLEADVSRVSMGYFSNSISGINIKEGISSSSDSLGRIVVMLEEDYASVTDEPGFYKLTLPKGKVDGDEKTLAVGFTRDGEILSYSYFPIRWDDEKLPAYYGDGISGLVNKLLKKSLIKQDSGLKRWQLAIPDKDFSIKLEGYENKFPIETYKIHEE